MNKPLRELGEIDKGGRYVRLEDGTIVPAPAEDEAAADQAEGGAGHAVGAASGDAPRPPEDTN